eukprot:scaffold6944_cov118-Isochrysis_galbana.AAC.9
MGGWVGTSLGINVVLSYVRICLFSPSSGLWMDEQSSTSRMAIIGWVSQLPAGADGRGGSLYRSLKFIFRMYFVEEKLTKI